MCSGFWMNAAAALWTIGSILVLLLFVATVAAMYWRYNR